ncbi:ankyrin repeat domain-containing protein [Candidatus Mesenet endosymbiont of Phosphuga atrata]|uniref:ankyrin repeat domain-containing protein n=1 Tax=Candidatus Mesenet endosymbiont of Phosphuga atrata TaxID=3066221 RepID=UPI0030D17F6F
MSSTDEFLAAVKRGDVEKVRSLLTQKIDVNARDYSCKYTNYYRKTALHIAVESGNKEIVELLLKHKEINVNAKLNGDTALYVAASCGHVGIVELLLDHEKIDVNTCDLYERTALYVAAEKGYTKIVGLLLKYGANINAQDLDEKAILHVAASCGHVKVVELLLDHEEIDIDAKFNGKTALHIAAEKNHIEMVKLFLKHGINTESGNVALRYAVINNHKEIMCLLLIYDVTLDENNESKINNELKECLIVFKEIKKMPNLDKLMEINKSKDIEKDTNFILGFINDKTKKQELIKEFEAIKKRHPYERLFFILEYLLDFVKHIFLKFLTNKKVVAAQLHESKNDIKVTTKDGIILENLPYEAAERIVSYFDADTNKAVSLVLSKKVDAFLTKLKEAVFEVPEKSLIEATVGSIKLSTECCVT